MSRLPLLLLAAITCSGAPALAQPANSAHAHAPMSGGQPELGATAAFAPDGVLWAVHKVSGHIAISRSGDGGRSWANPVLVTPTPELTDAGSDARPKIALGPAGEIYLTWTRPLAQPYTGEIRFSHSRDHGRSFSPPVVVHRDRQVITHRFDTIAVNPRGQVFVAWIDKRDLAAAGDNPKAYAGAALYYAVSDDGGGSFRGDFKVADHTCECCRIALAAQPDGSVVALWRHIFAPNIRDHALATLRPDGRAGPIRRATFEDWRIDACPHHGPALARGADGALHAVWFSAAPNHRGVFYGRLDGGGVDRGRQIGSEHAGHADVGADGREVVLAWKEVADGRSRLRVAIAAAGGAWRELELASVAGPADYPQVLTAAGRFHVFWHTQERPLAVLPVP